MVLRISHITDALVYESRQVTGPGLYETPVTGTLRSNPVTDQAGDAQWSHYSPTGTGSDQRPLDLLSLQLTQRDSAHLRFWTPPLPRIGRLAGYVEERESGNVARTKRSLNTILR